MKSVGGGVGITRAKVVARPMLELRVRQMGFGERRLEPGMVGPECHTKMMKCLGFIVSNLKAVVPRGP